MLARDVERSNTIFKKLIEDGNRLSSLKFFKSSLVKLSDKIV